MWSFSQPFYDLWINKFVRQNVFKSEFEKSREQQTQQAPQQELQPEIFLNKDYPTKWDLFELTTEIGGSLAKHEKIFPFFFGMVLLNAYNDKLKIIEFRTPLGNIYKNQQENKIQRYHLSVAAIFKNESKILKEWIEHYFLHGVEHIYLINDHSTDDFLAVL
jgi:hypothetical protein